MRTAQNLAAFVQLVVTVYSTIAIVLLTVGFVVLWCVVGLVGRLLR